MQVWFFDRRYASAVIIGIQRGGDVREEEKTGRICLKRLFLALYIPYAVNIPLAACVWEEGFGRRSGLARPSGQGLLAVGLACTWLWLDGLYNTMPRKKDFFCLMAGDHQWKAAGVLCSARMGSLPKTADPFMAVSQGVPGSYMNQRVLWINGISAQSCCLSCCGTESCAYFFHSLCPAGGSNSILMLLAMWIPGLNLGGSAHAMRISPRGIRILPKLQGNPVRQVRAQSQICSTGIRCFWFTGWGSGTAVF